MDARPHCLTVTVSLRISITETDVNSLESDCAALAREAFSKGVVAIQNHVQHAHKNRLVRREWRSRHFQSQLGTVMLPSLKVYDNEEGRSFMLANRLLDLAPRQRGTLWLEQRAVELRTEGLSYRQSAATLCDLTGAQVSPMWLWRRVQNRGQQCCEQESVSLAQEPLALPPPEHLYLEADGIYLKAQRSASSSHEVKVGLSYTGRERVPGYSHPRYRLAGKHLYGGVETFGRFGHQWYASLEHRHSVSRAEAILYLCDGETGFRHLRDDHFPHAIGQQDWAHVLRDLRRAAPDDARLARWTTQLYQGRADLVRRSIPRQSGGSTEAGLKVIRALNNGDFYGGKRFGILHDPNHTQRIPRGTGGIEKNQETTIGRVMKKRGMAWTARGAHHLVKLILARKNTNTWKNLWLEPFPP